MAHISRLLFLSGFATVGEQCTLTSHMLVEQSSQRSTNFEDHHEKRKIYRITELVGTSTKSWEDAAANAVETVARSLRELRVAEITKLDLVIESGKVAAYRARVSLSFKYEK